MVKRQLPDDFIEFIQCLNSSNVQYLLIGCWAVGIYGNPRATKDIDFLIAIDEDNLEKLQKALLDFGAPPVDIGRFMEKGYVIRIGSSPVTIKTTTSTIQQGVEVNNPLKPNFGG